ncbi:MAG: cbb3-type cytochrome c oxidase subunit 3 [Bacteroidetes bacterium]|jgi:cbb3-type cytochrome oxidase subunit 3|nr:cbb3-type cytochrome c oxidase subunit 3 [Bacteroidota bacterium]MBK8657923.1 cbb3-type cytochrome c oxidase subunit 3 [Bacteroidota bacterium]
MFSFVKKYTESLGGAEFYGDAALLVFVIVFAGMLWMALRADKNYIHELEQIPFND